MLMFGAEKSHVAPIASKTGFPMFIEFASPLITMNESNVNVIDLARFLNDKGYLRIPSILMFLASADVTLTLVLLSFNNFGICPVFFNFSSSFSDITGNLSVFPESKQALNVTLLLFVLRMMQLVLFACATFFSSQS